MRIWIISFILLTFFSKPYAGPGDLAKEGKEYVVEKGKGKFVRYSKNGVRSVLDKIPGGKFISDLILDDGESIEEKVDRIDKNQKTSLSRIREISSKVLSSKRKIEEMWRYKTWTIEQGGSLAEKLRNSRTKKLFGAVVENWLEIPINPAEYIPNIPPTQKLKESLDYDLSYEKRIINAAKSTTSTPTHLLSNTRSALIASRLAKENPQEFQTRYKAAEEYDILLMDAIQAKEITIVKIYKADIERLEEQIKVLEQKQTEKGLTVGEVMQIELVIDSKRKQIRKLNEKIDAAIKQSTILTYDEKLQVARVKAEEDMKELEAWFQDEKTRRQKLGK